MKFNTHQYLHVFSVNSLSLADQLEICEAVSCVVLMEQQIHLNVA
jgi:hypothetical protein